MSLDPEAKKRIAGVFSKVENEKALNDFFHSDNFWNNEEYKKIIFRCYESSGIPGLEKTAKEQLLLRPDIQKKLEEKESVTEKSKEIYLSWFVWAIFAQCWRDCYFELQ